mmetsp:Transcript_3270/g.4931  ORF Transcript_3270/g.4931 Transcript_3270/m.4931 type:complete len:258 (-) Transcript_3270:101-874(-)
MQDLLRDFKKLVTNEDNDSALSKFDEIKRMMVEMDSLPPICADGPNAESERELTKEALEYAVLLSLNLGDKDLFQKHISCLRPYYTSSSIDSELKNTILGLNLLFLLVENRLADFHCELELLSEPQRQHPAITFCTQLDKHLVVGAYDEVLAAAAHPPVAIFSFFLTSLLETVRINIGECIAAAYSQLSVTAAREMLMFSSDEEVLSFIGEQYPTWTVMNNHTINLLGVRPTKAEEIAAMRLITQNLSYATELERIV